MTATKPNKSDTVTDTAVTVQQNGKTDFETAMDASGFGLFNILLLLVAFPAAITTVFSTSTMSYIFPSAECDLKLTLLDKGILNAITYAGMITSAVLWGYISDTKGRKKVLVIGLGTNFICMVGTALSQTVFQLMIFKYLEGFIVNGPFAVLMTYLTELHGKWFRQRVMMCVGFMFATGVLLLPVLALLILPQNWDIHIIGLQLRAWQIFLLVSAVPCLLSCIFLSFFPESPKFLMSKGRNQEAMAAFQKIYALNKHKPKDTYPIKELVDELALTDTATNSGSEDAHSDDTLPAVITPDVEVTPATLKFERSNSKISHLENGTTCKQKKNGNQLSAGLTQLRPLFTKPYLVLSLRVYLLNFCVLLSQNTIRLWLPQLFASITEYEELTTRLPGIFVDDNSTQLYDGGDVTSSGISICEILDFTRNRTQELENLNDEICVVHITPASYTNNLIVGAGGLLAYTVAGFLVNLIGVKRILILCTFTAGVCGISMYWSYAAWTTVLIASISVTMGSISGTSVITASVSLFPTSLRTMVVSLEMMFGRCGSLLGNIFFPALVSLGCVPPFFMISFFMFFACLIAAFLPIKNKTALK